MRNSHTITITKSGRYCHTKTTLYSVITGISNITQVCPGWVRSDMGGAGATYSIEEGHLLSCHQIFQIHTSY